MSTALKSSSKNIKGFTLISKAYKGFTLIELLIVISIIGLLMALSIFGLIGARESARDARRRTDLEQIRSGVEVFRSDCNKYPVNVGTTLTGDNSVPTCPTTNVYISTVPTDPLSPARAYIYSSNGTTYEICTSLESGGSTVTCGGSSSCGGSSCNYKVTNP